jgi:hypothetical protein
MRQECQQVGYMYKAGIEPTSKICGKPAVDRIGDVWYCAEHFDKWTAIVAWVKVMRAERESVVEWPRQ